MNKIIPYTMDTIWQILAGFYFFLVFATVIALILDKRNPVKTLSWMTVIVMLPFIGFFLYITFGQNMRRKRRKLSRKERGMQHRLEKMAAKQRTEMDVLYFDIFPDVHRSKNIIKLLLNNNRSPLTMDNDIVILNDARATLESIKEELNKAKRYIHIEYYIIEQGEMWSDISAILKKKSLDGLDVRIIFDDVGSWGLKRRHLKPLIDCGVKVESFMPVLFPNFTSRINHRNHRKIVVVDGKVAFTGGINIADRYLYGNKKIKRWRDTHLKITGGAALSLETIFIADWCFCSKEQLDDALYMSATVNSGGSDAVQIASSGPDSHWASIMQAFFLAITSAKEHIYISTPYFIPTEAILTALKVAAMSGVDVKIMLPHRPDTKITYWATRSYISELLEANIKVYMYEGGFNHSKILMVDSMFSTIGTVNMDVRSFEQNFEVTAMIYDKAKTIELENYFLADLAQSILITTEIWRRNRRISNLYEGLARLLSPLL